MRFTGKDAEINVASPGGGHKAEFVSWRWEPMKNLPELIVPFKRPVYERVVKEFAKLAGVQNTWPESKKSQPQTSEPLTRFWLPKYRKQPHAK